MAQFLLEIFSEEIPARMQIKAAEDLLRLVQDGLKAHGITASHAEAHSTPRRLCVVLDGLPLQTEAVSEERKGPREGSPPQAIDGFLKSAGLKDIAEAELRQTDKGAFWVAMLHKPGQKTAEILPGVITSAVQSFPWPKSMRWSAGSLNWVRPLHSIIALLDGKVLEGGIDTGDGVVAFGNQTRGHRFLAPDAFSVTDFADYKAKLAAAKVILCRSERKKAIADGLNHLAYAQGLLVQEDAGLLEEVCGLVEYPVPLLGTIDDDFMSVPHEIRTATMRANQKYFTLTHANGVAAPFFGVIANMTANDGGKAIVAGNERVLRARLSDAKFFWDNDLKTRLADRVEKLGAITFQAKLGSQLERVGRIQNLAKNLAQYIPGCDADKAGNAGWLCKADLVSEVVGEFPEMQGLMGRYLALNDGLDAEIAQAISDHYKPVGASDSVPTEPVSIAVALADKLDTLTGFFLIDEKPTGSKDPYALRRAALGVIRIILENRLDLNLKTSLGISILEHVNRQESIRKVLEEQNLAVAAREGLIDSDVVIETTRKIREKKPFQRLDGLADLLAFFIDRLKVSLREQGVSHDLVDAVLTDTQNLDILQSVTRVAALQAFLGGDDGAALLAGYRRAANMVKAEAKKDKIEGYGTAVSPDLLTHPAETVLFEGLQLAKNAISAALSMGDFQGAMAAMAALRPAVDGFFTDVLVNDPNLEIRRNRLCLLSAVQATMNQVADFSKIVG